MIRADIRYPASMAVAYANPPDLYEARVWQRYLHENDLFVDVGANVGIYSVLAAERGAKVVAIEPDPETSKQLRTNLARNDYHAEVHRVVVSNSVGDVSFTVNQGTMNGIVFDEDVPQHILPCSTLDELIGERSVAGIKIDVEGAERLVVEGAKGLLARGVGMLQIEWNAMSEVRLGESRTPLHQLLVGAGYALYRPDEHGRLHPVHGGSDYGTDVFAVPAKSAAI